MILFLSHNKTINMKIAFIVITLILVLVGCEGRNVRNAKKTVIIIEGRDTIINPKPDSWGHYQGILWINTSDSTIRTSSYKIISYY